MNQPVRPEPQLTADLVQRLREACCDETGQRVDLDDHAERVAKEVARMRAARNAMNERAAASPL